MKKVTLLNILFIFLIGAKAIAQDIEKIHLLTPERSLLKGTTSEKLLQLGDMNGQAVLVISECEKGCTPAMYKKQEKESKLAGKNIYFNVYGLYVISYNEKSYITVAPKPFTELGKGEWKEFSFMNFYSTDQSELKEMTEEKIADYAKGIAQKVLTGQ